jgi:hypothetical protein
VITSERAKNEAILTETAKEWGIDPKSEMYKLPAMYVGEYAERDAEMTLQLWEEMKKEIYSQDIEDIFKLETELFPCLVDMRFFRSKSRCRRSAQIKRKLTSTRKRMLTKNKKRNRTRYSNMGLHVQLRKSFKKLNLPFDRTEKTSAPSFTKNFLQNHPHPIVKQIARAREINKSHTTFY